MKLAPIKKLKLLKRSRNLWIRAEENVFAHNRAFNKMKKISDGLKFGTIVSAGVTFLSGAFSDIILLTIIAGLFVTLLPIIERAYNPAQRNIKYSKSKANLKFIQGSLVDFSTCLDEKSDFQNYEVSQNYLSNIYNKIVSIEEDSQIKILENDRKKAKRNFGRSMVYDELEEISEQLGEPYRRFRRAKPEQAEDASDIIAAFRPKPEGLIYGTQIGIGIR